MADDRYETLPYPGKPYPFAHPDRLATLAHLYGLTPPPVETARILELGCGDATNVLALGYQLPRARVVGVDLNDAGLDEARRCAEACGLSNVELVAADIGTLDASLGRFDYVIAHGVFSWIPEPVRRAMMGVIGQVLEHDGVAMVSFNVLPGWHFRGIARAAMQWHASQFETPTDQVGAGREMLRFLADGLSDRDFAYARVLQEMVDFVEPATDAYLFHDLLAPVSDPVYFQDFAALAGQSGLQYLAEADYGDAVPETFPPTFQQVLTRLEHVVRREQLIDLMRNTMFRRSLLCPARSAVRRPVEPSRALGLRAVMTGRHTGPGAGDDAGGEVFETGDERTVTVFDPLVQEVLRRLDAVSPRSLPLRALISEARQATGGATPDPEVAAMMLQLYAGELIELRPRERALTLEPGERPRAASLVRWQLEQGRDAVTSALHAQVELGALEKAILSACDGTRTRGEILRHVVAAIERGEVVVRINEQATDDPEVLREAAEAALPGRLQRIAEVGLLEVVGHGRPG